MFLPSLPSSFSLFTLKILCRIIINNNQNKVELEEYVGGNCLFVVDVDVDFGWIDSQLQKHTTVVIIGRNSNSSNKHAAKKKNSG